MIADAFTPEVMADYPNVDGVAAFVHGTGCGMAGDGDGFEALQRVMWGYARRDALTALTPALTFESPADVIASVLGASG